MPHPSEAGPDGPNLEASPKILYIESHSALRDMLVQLINLGQSYQVEVAQNGLEGIQKARTWQPDLIITGLRLPVMDGYEVIKVIRSNPIIAHTPIIVISAWANATSKQRALAAGANEHLTPPVDIFRLLKKINSYLNQGKQSD